MFFKWIRKVLFGGRPDAPARDSAKPMKRAAATAAVGADGAFARAQVEQSMVKDHRGVAGGGSRVEARTLTRRERMGETNDNSDDGDDGVLSGALDIGLRVGSTLDWPRAKPAPVDQVVAEPGACNDDRAGARAEDDRSETRAVCEVPQADDEDSDRGGSVDAAAGGSDDAGDDDE